VTVMALTGLQEKTESLAAEHDVPGVAFGIFCDGEEHYAYHGVTSVENPLAAGPSTPLPGRLDHQDIHGHRDHAAGRGGVGRAR
jgi:hypothetical protein